MLSNILNIYCKNIFNNFLIAESCRTRTHLFHKLPSPAPAPESRNAPVLHRIFMTSNGEKTLLVMSLNKFPANNIFFFFFQNLTHSLSKTESYHLLSLSSPPPPPPSPLLLLSANNQAVLAIKPVGSCKSKPMAFNFNATREDQKVQGS